MDEQRFEKENRERIQGVESSFGASGSTLLIPGRILMGQGCLTKQGRRRQQPKMFFLFNDVLVYGTILLNDRWYKNQQIIPLEDLEIEDMEDGVAMKNQWLIRTRRKSFYVCAPSREEKQAWISHIKECQSDLLGDSGRKASSTFATTWIPDRVACKCMRCFANFTQTRRRHHCRKCGFLVCNSCSKHRELLTHIHPKKVQRVCRVCHTRNNVADVSRLRGDSPRKNSSEEDDLDPSSEEEDEGEMEEAYMPSSWLNAPMGTWGSIGTYVYPRPMHLRPQSF